MMRLLILILLVYGCKSEPEMPANVLSPQKMQAVLWDMIQADGVMANPLPNDSTAVLQLKRTQWYSQVLRVHKVSKETFTRSVRYYQSKPELLKTVLTDLSEKKAKLPSFPPDSTRPAKKPILPRALLK